jgi:hypothetical protein
MPRPASRGCRREGAKENCRAGQLAPSAKRSSARPQHGRPPCSAVRHDLSGEERVPCMKAGSTSSMCGRWLHMWPWCRR